MQFDNDDPNGLLAGLSRRDFVGGVLAGGIVTGSLAAAPAPNEAATVHCTLTINGVGHELDLDPRTTLLDLLREQLQLTGTKKGCDHGQCGACTVLVDGRRMNSCLSLAVSNDGAKVTTVEGLARGNDLHPMQAAFLEHDGFQCGYCTPGQICSAVGFLSEAQQWSMPLDDDAIREGMSGNVCRCGAYPNIVTAVRTVGQQRKS